VGGLPLHLIASALQTSLNRGYMLIKMYAEPTGVDQHRALSVLGNWGVDGILVVAPDLCEYEAVEALSMFPAVLLNRLDPGQLLTCFAPDEEGAGVRAAQLLLDQGHRDVGLLSGSLSHFQTGLRARGVQRAVAAAGVPPAQLQTAEVRIDARVRGGYHPAHPGSPAHRLGLHQRSARGGRPARGVPTTPWRAA
jgi:LacI family transcriptional regulator